MFFKGLPGLTRQSERELLEAAHDSVYYWWWCFLRLSPVIWYAKKRGVRPVDPAIRKVVDECGDLYRQSFSEWWLKTGMHLFVEAHGLASVKRLELDQLRHHYFDPNSLYFEVPLTITKARIVREFRAFLNEAHEGRRLNLAATSRAQWRLHTKRFRLRTIEFEYWTLLYKLLAPNATVWQIGDRLQIAPHLKVRDADRRAVPERFAQLSSLAGRFLYKSRYTLSNAERGLFPNSAKIDVPDDYQPFGKKHHADYLQATTGASSAWMRWLKSSHMEDLIWHIQAKNARFLGDENRAGFDEAFDSFVKGKTDSIR